MNKSITRHAGFRKEVERVEAVICPGCGQPVDEKTFKYREYLREFKVSGLCEKCQDLYFNEKGD